jgi:hypothetical protein
VKSIHVDGITESIKDGQYITEGVLELPTLPDGVAKGIYTAPKGDWAITQEDGGFRVEVAEAMGKAIAKLDQSINDEELIHQSRS